MGAGELSLPPGTPREIEAFYAYWLSLPKTALLPRLDNYLDNAPASHQPLVAIADVASATDWKLRLVGTGLVHLGGQDPTGAALNKLYARQAQELIGKLAWEVVSRPVGYLSRRRIKTYSGRMVEAPAITLPMENPQSAIRVLVTYLHTTFADLLPAVPKELELSQELVVTHWIDVGAGTPAQIGVT